MRSYNTIRYAYAAMIQFCILTECARRASNSQRDRKRKTEEEEACRREIEHNQPDIQIQISSISLCLPCTHDYVFNSLCIIFYNFMFNELEVEDNQSHLLRASNEALHTTQRSQDFENGI